MRYLYYITEVSTEEFTQKEDAELGQHELDTCRVNPNTDDIEIFYTDAYRSISRANGVIENVPNIQMNEQKKNKIVGEARFLRGLHYFNLVRVFGEVPILTSEVTSLEELYNPTSTIEEIYNLIIEDLEFAVEHLIIENVAGHANKVAAWGLLADIYVTIASASHAGIEGYGFGSGTNYYALAAKFSGKVINEQTIFGFEENLLDIYDIDKENQGEHIFSVQGDRDGEDQGLWNDLGLLVTPYFNGQIVEVTDGTAMPWGWQHLWMEIPFYNSFQSFDKRRVELMVDSVISSREIDDQGNEIINYQFYPNGGMDRPFIRKYIDPYRLSGSQASGNNFTVIRYSAQLLTFAEATGPTPEGFAAINQVWNRTGLPNLFAGLDEELFREACLQERSWELAFEGQRLFDLRRTGKMEEILEGQYGKNIVQHPYFFPIPLIETDQNPFVDENP